MKNIYLNKFAREWSNLLVVVAHLLINNLDINIKETL